MKVEITEQERQALLNLLSRVTIQGNEAQAFLTLASKFGEVKKEEPPKKTD